MRRMSSRSALLVMMVVLGACEAPPGALEPTDPEAMPEIAITASEIAASYHEEGGFLISPVLEAPDGATRVGALVTLASEAAEAPRLEARGLDEHGVARGWRPLEVTFAEDDQRVVRVELGFVARGAQLRIPSGSIGAIAGITWSAVVPARESEAPIVEGDVGRATQALRAEYASAGVIPRSTWGARATRCTDTDPNKHRMAIHHTVTPATSDPATRLRGIQAYHMDTQGWCDIGYHFLISLDGRVWEGRAVELLGAHVASHNTGNIGISFIGCFHSSGCSDWTPFTPPDAMIEAAADMVRLSSTLYDIPIDATNVKGHRDHAGATTSCPGDNLHAELDRIRTLAGAGGPMFRAEYVHQSFPLASQPFELRPNEQARGYLEMRNTGTATWEPGMTFLGTTEPRDVASPLAAPDWISPSRAASIDTAVPPGATGRFEFAVRAPTAPGDYPQYFNLVQEGVAWFSDPGQGGPPDAVIQIRVTTLDAPAVVDDGGAPSTPDAGSEPDGGSPIIGLTDAGSRPDAVGGCGCRAGATPSSSPLALVFAMIALGFAIRRR